MYSACVPLSVRTVIGKEGLLVRIQSSRLDSRTANRYKPVDALQPIKEYGVRIIEFYDAHRCYTDAEAVVDEFLGLLSKLAK